MGGMMREVGGGMEDLSMMIVELGQPLIHRSRFCGVEVI